MLHIVDSSISGKILLQIRYHVRAKLHTYLTINFKATRTEIPDLSFLLEFCIRLICILCMFAEDLKFLESLNSSLKCIKLINHL